MAARKATGWTEAELHQAASGDLRQHDKVAENWQLIGPAARSSYDPYKLYKFLVVARSAFVLRARLSRLAGRAYTSI